MNSKLNKYSFLAFFWLNTFRTHRQKYQLGVWYRKYRSLSFVSRGFKNFLKEGELT